jgi:predicted CXXCH cytochrome family protein
MPAARVLLAGAALVLLPPLAFVVTDHAVYHFERENAFCVRCHLHERLLATCETAARHAAADRRATATDLAALHFAASDEPRCIACHKGEGTIERAKVLAVAARDGLKYLAGVHREPDHSDVPIADAGCTRCHARLGATADERDFHRRPEHRGLPVACVGCHRAHRGGDPAQSFLVAADVLPACRRCHANLGR